MPRLWQADADTVEGEIEGLSKLTTGMKRRIRRRLSVEKPTIWVGKSGVSRELMGEIEKQLDKKEMVKIKILKTALSEDEANQIALRIAEWTKASLVDVRGHVFMLYKRRKK